MASFSQFGIGRLWHFCRQNKDIANKAKIAFNKLCEIDLPNMSFEENVQNLEQQKVHMKKVRMMEVGIMDFFICFSLRDRARPHFEIKYC